MKRFLTISAITIAVICIAQLTEYEDANARISNVRTNPSTIYADTPFSVSWNTNLRSHRIIKASIQVIASSGTRQYPCDNQAETKSSSYKNGRMNISFESEVQNQFFGEWCNGRAILTISEPYTVVSKHKIKKMEFVTEVELRIYKKP